MRWIAFNTGLLSRSITDTGMLWKVWSECIHITGRLVQCLLSAWGLPGWLAILIISISGRFGRNRKRQKVCGRWSNACQGKNMTEPAKGRSCSFLMRFCRMDRKAVHENFYNEANKRCRRKKMKKLLAVLLGMAFAVNLLLVLSIVGECGSPRRALYTITDGMMNIIYRFRNGRNAKTLVLWF